MENVVIVGTGPAGLTAAVYAARAGLSPVIYAGLQHGGQLTTTTEIENFPGFAEPIMGPKLMMDMAAQAERVGARIIYDEISAVDFSTPKNLLLTNSQGQIQTKTVIIATGATAKTLGLEGEKELIGRGLSTCATCDGFFYRGKKVAVLGGGDSAMEEALYLANLCQKVTLIHRRDSFRASKIMVDRLKSHPKIELMIPYALSKTLSDASGLTGVRLEHLENGSQRDLELDGLFYAIGHQPNSKIFLPWVDTDEHGYIKIGPGGTTKTKGVFAAGDIADPVFKQAITAAGMGCQSAIAAARYIESMGH